MKRGVLHSDVGIMLMESGLGLKRIHRFIDLHIHLRQLGLILLLLLL